jgi:DNA invertase Pin-like site-specific DNA recombinase
MSYGYTRVSTDGQSVDAQVRQLTKAGCKEASRETTNGAKTSGAQLRKVLDQLDTDDVRSVTRLGHLARCPRDHHRDRMADFRSLGDT